MNVAVAVAVSVGVLVGDGVGVSVGVLDAVGVGLGRTSVASTPTIRETRNCSTVACLLAVKWSHG